MTATLGGLIKDYRLRKRLSQVDLSLSLGWKDTSRLSKIEQGRVGKPNRDTAERIINALNLTHQEKGHFLLVGGYLPTEQEISNILEETKEKIDTWRYPAYLMDFSFRWLYANKHTLFTAKMNPNQLSWIIENKPSFLSFPFFPKEQFSVIVKKGEDQNSLKSFAIAQIAAFKGENEQYQNEKWYKNLVKDLMQFEEFRKLWPEVNQETYGKKLFDYEYKTMQDTYNGKYQTLSFHVSTAKVINDPRFQLVMYHPADKNTEKLFSS